MGLKDVDKEVLKLPPAPPSRFIADYMHLKDFKEVIDRTKTLHAVMNVNPISVLGFTRENQEIILQSLMHGAGVKNALALAGVKEVNYNTWVKLAEREVEPFATFIQECKKAEALLETSLFQSMRAGGWKGAVEYYKLTRPELFYPGAQGSSSQANIQINIMDRKPEERKAIFEQYKQIHIDEKDIIEYNVKEED
jgi:hypothetical protein